MDLNAYKTKYEERYLPEIIAREDLRSKNLESLNLPSVIFMHLYQKQISTIEDLTSISFEELYEIFNKNNFYIKYFIIALSHSLFNISNTNNMYWYQYSDYVINRLSTLDDSFLEQLIPYIDFSDTRITVALRSRMIYTYKDLTMVTPIDLYEIEGIGPKSMTKFFDFIMSNIMDKKPAKKDSVNEDSPTSNDRLLENPNILAIKEMLSSFSEEKLNLKIMTTDVRLFNCLARAKISTFNDLKAFGIEDLFRTKNFGKKTLETLVSIVEGVYSLTYVDNQTPSNYMQDFSNRLKEEAETYDFESNIVSNNDYSDLKIKLLECVLEECAQLDPRKYEIFKSRLLANETLEQVGNRYGVSRERIRQIETKVSKNLIASFCNPAYYQNSVSLQRFYKYLFDENDFVSMMVHLIEPQDIISNILIKMCAINHAEKISFYALKHNNQEDIKTALENAKFSQHFKELKRWPLYDAIRNLEDVQEIIPERINLLDSHMPKNVDLYDKIKNMLSKYKNMRFISYPYLGKDLNAGGALVINEKIVILLIYVKDEDDLVSEKTIELDKNLKEFCKDIGYGYAICSSKSKSLNEFLIRKPDSIAEKKLNTALDNAYTKADHIVKNICFKYNLKKQDVISIGVNNGYVFKTNPLSIYRKDDPELLYEEQRAEENLETIKYRAYSPLEKKILNVLVVLTNNYVTKKNKIWIQTIRVFLSGTKASHLYQECKRLPYFGTEPNIKTSEITSIMNAFVDLGIVNELKNDNGKPYYEINADIIAKSHILEDVNYNDFEDEED